MNNKVPIIELDKYDRIWLEEIYSQVKENKNPEQRQIWTKLYGKLPRNFQTASIDPLLCNASGEYITLLGIIAVEKNYSTLETINKLLYKIKDTILSDSTIIEIDLTRIAEDCNVDPVFAGVLLKITFQYGNFYRSATVYPGGFGYSSINLGSSDNLYQRYFLFDGMEEVISEYLVMQKKNDEKKKLQKHDLKNNDSEVFTPIFTSKVSHINKSLCFVLMPFTEEWSDRVYSRLIRQNIEQLGLQCLRADNFNGPIIMEDIWVAINQAAIIIADVTGKNANVMYEMGIVHAIGKPCILITQDLDNIPFDFSHLRHHGYKDNIQSFESFGFKIKSVITELHKTFYPNSKLFT